MLHHSWAVFFHSGGKAAFVSSFCVSHGNFDSPSKSFVYLLVILQDDNLFKLRDYAFIVLENFFLVAICLGLKMAHIHNLKIIQEYKKKFKNTSNLINEK